MRLCVSVPVLKGGAATEVARFWSKVDRQDPNECWPWLAQLRNGYGQFHTYRRNKVTAHRFAYELEVGKIPAGLTLDHLCRNRSCVNPAHLEPVTQRENVLRGVSPAARHARATECPHGHPYDDENTYIRYDGRRVCRTCQRGWDRMKMRRRRARAKLNA